MRTIICLTAALSFCGLAMAADEDADRAKLAGAWEIPGDQGWSFTNQGDTIKVTETEKGNKIADFVCNTDGKACVVKIGGKKANVSFYYNGAKLVEIEERGSEVIKRRFAADTDANTMLIEVMPMVPSGTNQTLKLKRASAAVAAK